MIEDHGDKLIIRVASPPDWKAHAEKLAHEKALLNREIEKLNIYKEQAMNKDDLSMLWIGAFRYYCGRMTIAVHSFTESLIKHWDDIPEGAQSVIRRDLDEAFADDRRDRERKSEYGYRLGHDCDRLAWKKVREHINEI